MVTYVQIKKENMKDIKFFIETMEGILACKNNIEGGNKNWDFQLTQSVIELKNFLHMSMIGKFSYILLTDSYDSFRRKHIVSKYIRVDELDFLFIPKYKQQSD